MNKDKKTYEKIEEFLESNKLAGIFCFFDQDTRKAVAGGYSTDANTASYLINELKSMLSARKSEEEKESEKTKS